MEYKTALYDMIDQHVEQTTTEHNEIRAKGHRFDVNVTHEMVNSIARSLTDDSGSSSMIRDMSNDKNKDWQVLAGISAELKQAETAEELAAIFLKEILSLTDGNYSMFLRAQRAQDTFVFWQAYPDPEAGEQLQDSDLKQLRDMVDTQEPVYLDSSALQQKHRTPVNGSGALSANDNSLLLAMVTSQGELIGALLVGLGDNRVLTAETLETLQAVVVMASDVLNRASIMHTLENLVSQRTKELTAANSRLLELDHLKTKFIQDISHEFRTPLTSIGLYLSLLEKESSDTESRYIEALKRQTDQLTHLINAVLDVSDPERIMGLGMFEEVNLKGLVQEIVDIKEPYARTRGIEMTRDLDDVVWTKGNAESLQRLVSNLIDNAISYTQEGSIQVALTRTKTHARISVADTGLGIPEPEIEHIFDRFYRGTEVSQLDIPGSGLGLSMVKQIVEQHNGRIEVDSQPMKGSTFRVWLPLANKEEENSPYHFLVPQQTSQIRR